MLNWPNSTRAQICVYWNSNGGHTFICEKIDGKIMHYSYSGSSFASSLDDEDSDGDVDWRLFADEGDKYGVDPYDFDTVDIKKVYSTSTTISGDIEDVVDELKKLTNKDEGNE